MSGRELSALSEILEGAISNDDELAWSVYDRIEEFRGEPAYIAVLYHLIEESPWHFIIDAAAKKLVYVERAKSLSWLLLAVRRLWHDTTYDADRLLKEIGYAIAAGGEESTTYLLGQLQSADSLQREIAVLFLRFTDEVATLLNVLHTDSDNQVRAQAIHSLAILMTSVKEDPEIYAALVGAGYDQEETVRIAAVSVLSLWCTPEAKAVIDEAARHPSERVRKAASEAMKTQRGNGCT